MKILFLTSRFPFPLEKGDKLRAYHLIRSLSKHADIYLFAVNETRVPEAHVRELLPYCKAIEVAVVNKPTSIISMAFATFQLRLPFQVAYFSAPAAHMQMRAFIKKHEPNAVFCHLIRMGEYLRDLDIRPVVLDYMDTFSKGMARRAEQTSFPANLFIRAEERRLHHYEAACFKRCDRHLVISAQDRDAFSFQGKGAVEVVANGVDFAYYSPVEAVKKFDLLFIGNMAYPPNISSSTFAAKEVMPELHKLHPGASLVIAGADPVRAVRNLESEHVKVSGWVEDPRQLFGEARIMIAPMLISIGLQNKILQAMAMKLPCVISRLANNAIGAPEENCVLVADTPQEYAQQIKRLLDDEDLRLRIAENAYAFVKEHFDWDRNCDRILKLMQQP